MATPIFDGGHVSNTSCRRTGCDFPAELVAKHYGEQLCNYVETENLINGTKHCSCITLSFSLLSLHPTIYPANLPVQPAHTSKQGTKCSRSTVTKQ